MIKAFVYRCFILTVLGAAYAVNAGSRGDFKEVTPADRDTHSSETRQTESFTSDTRAAPRGFRLFVQGIEASASPQMPASSEMVPLRPRFQLPSRQVVFRSDKVPLVERHVAQRMADDVSGGTSTAVDPYFFNMHKRKEVLAWSRAQFVDPEAEFFLHDVPPTPESPYVYFAKTLPWDELRDPILQEEELENRLGNPFAVYRARAGASNFWRDGEIEVAGIELFSKPSPRRVSQRAPRTVKLRELLRLIERAG
ncbi:uncharacterized protein UTRI_06212 [Ustilago trichophora]|uniref:Effector family protein Eff1 n=1 Tax=Ustilago trichophora TaxID=86804 RepID=A0A5C3EF33_9BASI|nr:uncharacterized protein UTRI_06212 [Ustilago trichophora]